MGKKYTGEVAYPVGYSVGANAPLDDRLVVETYSDLTTNFSTTFDSLQYQGLVVSVVDDADTSLNGPYYLSNDTTSGADPVWIKLGTAVDPIASQIIADDTSVSILDDGVNPGIIQFTVDSDVVMEASVDALTGATGANATRSTLGTAANPWQDLHLAAGGKIYVDNVELVSKRTYLVADVTASGQTVDNVDLDDAIQGSIIVDGEYTLTFDLSSIAAETGNFTVLGKNYHSCVVAFSENSLNIVTGASVLAASPIFIGMAQKMNFFKNGDEIYFILETA